MAGSSRPLQSVVLTSPYVRAERTASIMLDHLSAAPECILDERLREREFGGLDRLTRVGIEQRFPDQAEARARLGKFYYRPPGGESWCDVALRTRGVLDTLGREYAGEHVLIVSHQVVILMFRYVIERLTEAAVLALGRGPELSNCSITSFLASQTPKGRPVLEWFNEVRPLEQTRAPITAEPDVAVA